jgi:hypothetical protein
MMMFLRWPTATSHSHRLASGCGLAGGAILLGMSAALAARSEFLWNWAWASDEVLHLFVLLCMAAGLLYLIVVGCLRNMAVGRAGLAWIVLVGLLMRVVLLPAFPVLETDSFRYMWDGALTASGISPYVHTPAEGQRALADAGADPALRAVARGAEPYLRHFNHPDVKAIYPPVAQAAFAVAHRIEPWNWSAWRAVLLSADLATLGLLLALLHRLRLPIAWVTIYWWNPLVVKEFFCAAHMDAIVLPFVLGALLLTINGRTTTAAVCLAAAVAAKLWPILLLPALLRSAPRRPRRVAIALGAFVLVAAVLLAPMYLAGPDGVAGTQTYSRAWRNNDGLFRLNVLLWENALPLIGLKPWAAQMAARGTAAVLLIAWIAWLSRGPLADPLRLSEACLLAVAGLFLLSPTQFPWYYTWMLPLLALRPRWSLLLYTALLPLYHLHYRQAAWVWVEHVPVWGLMLVEFLSGRVRFPRLESNTDVPSHDNIAPTAV